MKRNLIIFSVSVLVLCAVCSCQTKNMAVSSLAGNWNFALDSNDVGEKDHWAMQKFPEFVKLPGSLQEQGKGYDISVNTQWTGAVNDKSWYVAKEYEKYREPGNIKVPFWLNPDKHYVGVAWYQKEIEIPEAWTGKRILFELERTHWETSLYMDGQRIEHQDALLVPHRYLINSLTPGKHLLSLRVDNRMHIDVGANAHSISDHTQTNWNGVIGEISMQALPSLVMDDIQIYPDAKNKKAKIRIHLSGEVKKSQLEMDVFLKNRSVLGKKIVMDIDPGVGNSLETEVELADSVQMWSEFTPNVYRLHASLSSPDGTCEKNVNFGFREFKANGTHFEVNGQTTFLRGTLECCIFPLTGYPAMTTDYWTKIYTACKNHGLNHVRFHSWCPPAAAFQVADSMGMYLQVECGGWTWIGEGKKQDEWFKEEGDRILKEYGNHPSFCMLAYGNEPGGDNQVKYLSELIAHWKQNDDRRLYTSSGGWPFVKNADYYNTDRPRIGGDMSNIINTSVPRTDYDHRAVICQEMPMLSHEIGQWCVFPNFKEIDKYTGVLKARNFEVFKETLNAKGLGDMADKFLYASGRLQTLSYKTEIETALRTPGLGGFQLLDLHDFPGQGTALVGVLDAFWEGKGYVDEKEYRMFCNHTVPLARLPKLVWNNDETFRADIEFAHFGEKPLSDARILWTVETKDGNVVKSGTFKRDLPIGNLIEAGTISFALDLFPSPVQLKLKVGIDHTEICNDWNIWVYPAKKAEIAGKPFITYEWNEAIDKLNQGEDVLFLSYGKVSPEMGGDIKVAFTPIFWNTAWTSNRPPHTLGFLCYPEHEAFTSFPNDGYSDFQWKDLAVKCNAMVMDDLPQDFRPIVYLIDDWFKNRKLGVLFEAKAGKGNLMVCSVDLDTDLDNRISVAQFKQSLLEYMASDKFKPQMEIDLHTLQRLFKKEK